MRTLEYKHAKIHVGSKPPFKVRAGDFYIYLIGQEAVLFEAVDAGVLVNLSGDEPMPSEEAALVMARVQIDRDEFDNLVESERGLFEPNVVAHKVQVELDKGQFELSRSGYGMKVDVELMCGLHNALPKEHALRKAIRASMEHEARTAENSIGVEAVVVGANDELVFNGEIAAAALSRRKANRHAEEVFRQLEVVSRAVHSALGHHLESQRTNEQIPPGLQRLIDRKEMVEPIDGFIPNLPSLLSQFQALNQAKGLYDLQRARLHITDTQSLPQPDSE